MFGSLGVPEILLIFVVVLIVFGPRRIPEIGQMLGKALGEFRKATDDLKSTIEREVRLEELKSVAPSIVKPLESVARFDLLSRTEPETSTPMTVVAETSSQAQDEPSSPADPEKPRPESV